MNYRLVYKNLSIILLILAFAFSICVSIEIYLNQKDYLNIIQAWIYSVSISFVLSLLLFTAGRNSKMEMFRREALCIIGLGWVLCSVMGAIPYWLIIPDFNFADAFFESASGFTTTGASVISAPENLPKSLQFWRCFSQWIGGLGVVVFFVAILSSVGSSTGAKILFSRESSAHSADFESSRIQQGLAKIFLLYLLLTFLCFFIFYVEEMSLFDAICHAFTTLSTGGFSNYSNSMAYFNSSAIEYTAVIFMIFGGTSFLLMLKLFTSRSLIATLKNAEYLTYLSFIGVFAFCITFFLKNQYPHYTVAEAFRVAVFQVTSIITTTGYATIDFNQAAAVAHVFLMILMLTGACSGSTSGGLKIIRVIAAFKICLYHIQKAFRPHLVSSIKIDNKRIDSEAQESIATYIVILAFIFLSGLFLVAFLEPNTSFEGTFSAILSCISNIGPGLAEVGPTKTFEFFSAPSKIFLSILMIVGRLEFYAILVLFLPSFWKKFT